MNDHDRISRALRGCAETRVPGTTDPWPEVRERVLAGRRPSQRFRFTPRTRLGWVFASLAMLLVFGTGAYAVTELSEEAYFLFLQEVPGATEVNKDQPGSADAGNVSVPLNLTQTAHGARVNIERAYADEGSIAVSFKVEDLEAGRRMDGWPTELSAGDATLTDESGNKFRSEGITSVAGANPTPHTVVFVPQEKIIPGEIHRFRLEFPVVASLYRSESSRADEVLRRERISEQPFVFEFEVPVRPIPIVEVNQKVTANGITLILDRVKNSPGRPEAIICFKTPDDEWVWQPISKPWTSSTIRQTESEQPGHTCSVVPLSQRPEGRSSVTVSALDPGLLPRGTNEENVDELDLDKLDSERPDPIRGPWTFEFEASER